MDYNATTPVSKRALDAMLPFFRDTFGNASSRHHMAGRKAEAAVEKARQQVADDLNIEMKEVSFTSGATESCNLAIQGIHALYQRKGNHIITVSTEHKAVLDCCKYLERNGAEITYLPVDEQGRLDLDLLSSSIRADTVLVAIMWANNETGLIHPMSQIGEICAKEGVLLFSDATQAVGKLDVKPRECGIQLLAFSAHKFGGPKGIGALYVSSRQPRTKVRPLMHGGGHEGGFRSGTLNVPGIVGLGAALEEYSSVRIREAERLAGLRDELERRLLAIDATHVSGSIDNRLSHVTNVRFDHVDGEALMAMYQSQLAVASGSACTSADPDPSHVLMAMGLTRTQAKASLRFSLGASTTESDVTRAAQMISDGVEKLRETSPAWQLHMKGLI